MRDGLGKGSAFFLTSSQVFASSGVLSVLTRIRRGKRNDMPLFGSCYNNGKQVRDEVSDQYKRIHWICLKFVFSSGAPHNAQISIQCASYPVNYRNQNFSSHLSYSCSMDGGDGQICTLDFPHQLGREPVVGLDTASIVIQGFRND